MFRNPIAIFLLCLILLGSLAPAGAMMPDDQKDQPKPVLFLLAEGFNREEFWTPYLAIQAAGYKVVVAAPEAGLVRLSDKKPHPQDAKADIALEQVKTSDYIGLVIPGGYSPGNLEKYPKALEIVRGFFESGKPVAGICHGPRLLMRAGLLENRVTTCLHSVKNELADEWAAGKYGKYVDQPVVVDDNLITSRYPQDSPAFARAFLEKLQADEGLEIPSTPAKALLLATGTDPHIRWVFRTMPNILATEVQLVAESNLAEAAKEMDLKQYGLLMVVDGPGYRKLADMEDFQTLVKKAKSAGLRIAAANEASELFRDLEVKPDVTFQGDMTKMLGQLAALTKRKPASDEPVADDLVRIRVEPGFSAEQYAALATGLRLLGKEPVPVAGEDGWVKSKQGPVVQTWVLNAQGSGSGETIALTGQKIHLDDHKQLQAWLEKATEANRGEDNPTAVLALRQGYDDLTALGVLAALRAEGYHVKILGPNTGRIDGVNGTGLQAEATYESAGDLPKDVLIVAPGSYWPEKTNKARQAEQPAWVDVQGKSDSQRLEWMMARYDKGATLMTFGLDSLIVGKQPRFKGQGFATTEQARWSFGKGGGKYDGEMARKSADRLISARGFEYIAEAMKLLDSGQ